MARKVQKFNKYSIELKNEILNKYFEGKGSSKSLGKEYGITISMSRKGTPIDDSPIESGHGLLKKETLYNNKYHIY